MDAAYVDKLDGKISEDFWQRKMSEWQIEEHQVGMAIDGLASAEIATEQWKRSECWNSRISPICCTLRRVLLKRPNC